jgi:MFS family permease
MFLHDEPKGVLNRNQQGIIVHDNPGEQIESDGNPAHDWDGGGTDISVRSWLPVISWEGACANIFVTLTGGAFLTGLALYLGANDFAIGLLAAIPFLAQIVQLISAFLADRTGRRKAFSVGGSIAGRQIWWLTLPLVFMNGPWRLSALIGIVAFANIAIMMSTPAWMAWMADLVPDKIRGRYFGLRSAVLSVAAIAATLAGGISLDHFRGLRQESLGYASLIVVGCLFAAIAAILLARIPDRPAATIRMSITWSHFLEPLKNRNFQHLLKVTFVWNLAIGICAAFFAAHMLTNLKMSFTLVSIYSSVPAVVAITLNRPWGVIIDRFGSKPVLVFCGLGLAVIPFIWLIPRPDFLWPLAFEAVYSGALWTGFNLATFNIPIANSPREGRTMYLAAFAVVSGVAFFMSSLAGGVLAQSWNRFHWQVGAQTFINYHILFAISGLFRFLAALLIRHFHEPVEKDMPTMLQFMGGAFLRLVSFGRLQLPWSPK